MEKNEEYAYSKNGKEIDSSLLEIYRKLHKKGYPIFALWSKPFIQGESSFIIITKDNIYLNEKNVKITQKHHEIIDDFYYDMQTITMYHIKEIKINGQIILIDHFNEEYKLNFKGTIPEEVMSDIFNEIKSASIAALEEKRTRIDCKSIKNHFERGMLTSREYNSYVKLMGSQWVDTEDNNTCFISEVFGFIFIDPLENSPTIKAQKNMCKDAAPIEITFNEINQQEYKSEKYEIIMNKCMTLLDKYDDIKKMGREELIKSYKEKGKLLIVIQNKLAELENIINDIIIDENYKIDFKKISEVLKVKNIIMSHEPNVYFSVEDEKIMIELFYKMGLADINMDGVSIKFDEDLNVIDIVKVWY